MAAFEYVFSRPLCFYKLLFADQNAYWKDILQIFFRPMVPSGITLHPGHVLGTIFLFIYGLLLPLTLCMDSYPRLSLGEPRN